MYIVCLQKYRCGFRGILEEPDHWVLFQYTRSGGLRRLSAYARADFRDRGHFAGVMGRFMPASGFLPAPLELTAVAMDGFERLWQGLSSGQSGGPPTLPAAPNGEEPES